MNRPPHLINLLEVLEKLEDAIAIVRALHLSVIDQLDADTDEERAQARAAAHAALARARGEQP